MPIYQKVCVIDQKLFSTTRLSTLFCSKHCRNRSRYMKPALLAQLVQRNQAFTINANKYLASVLDEEDKVTSIGYIPEGATKEHPLGKDEGLLMGLALLAKGKTQPKVVHKSGFILEDTPHDPAMKDFVLEDDNNELQNRTSNNINNPDNSNTLFTKEVIGQPKKYKIRRIGEKT